MRWIHSHQIVYSLKRNFNSSVKFVSDRPTVAVTATNVVTLHTITYVKTIVIIGIQMFLLLILNLQLCFSISWRWLLGHSAVKCSISSFLLDISQKHAIESIWNKLFFITWSLKSQNSLVSTKETICEGKHILNVENVVKVYNFTPNWSTDIYLAPTFSPPPPQNFYIYVDFRFDFLKSHPTPQDWTSHGELRYFVWTSDFT